MKYLTSYYSIGFQPLQMRIHVPQLNPTRKITQLSSENWCFGAGCDLERSHRRCENYATNMSTWKSSSKETKKENGYINHIWIIIFTSISFHRFIIFLHYLIYLLTHLKPQLRIISSSLARGQPGAGATENQCRSRERSFRASSRGARDTRGWRWKGPGKIGGWLVGCFFFGGGDVTCLVFVHVGDSNLDKMYVLLCFFGARGLVLGFCLKVKYVLMKCWNVCEEKIVDHNQSKLCLFIFHWNLYATTFHFESFSRGIANQ